MDAWVRDLAQELPEVLWVIFGREKLRWAETDPTWEPCLDQHLVERLAETDGRSFLESCRVRDPAVQEVIIAGARACPTTWTWP